MKHAASSFYYILMFPRAIICEINNCLELCIYPVKVTVTREPVQFSSRWIFQNFKYTIVFNLILYMEFVIFYVFAFNFLYIYQKFPSDKLLKYSSML